MLEDHSILLTFIQEAVRQGNFYITAHGVRKHTVAEGFRPSQAIEAILNGQVIENDDARSRCLICGQADGLSISTDFIANYVHCVCEYDNINNIVIVTMYRPSNKDWVNQHTRRRN